MTKIVMYGLLVETTEHWKQVEEGFKGMGFHKPKLVGKFETLPGDGGEGGRSDVVVEVNDKDVSKLAIHPMHLSGGFSWEDDYLANHRNLIPEDALKYFTIEEETSGPKTNLEVTLIGKDSNALLILGTVSKALRKAGHTDLAEQYLKETKSGNYDNLLRVTSEYVTVV